MRILLKTFLTKTFFNRGHVNEALARPSADYVHRTSSTKSPKRQHFSKPAFRLHNHFNQSNIQATFDPTGPGMCESSRQSYKV